MPNDVNANVLRQFVNGDETAFETLFRQFESEVYAWILRIVRDGSSAEDVLVDAFWRAYRARARFDWSRSFGAWMRTIATNAARDHLKAQGPPVRAMTADDDVAGPATGDDGLIEAVILAFDKLTPRLRIVATLALIEERPHEEIATALELPVGTVKSRVFRAVRVLRRELARQGIRP